MTLIRPDPRIIRRCRARWWEVQEARVAALEHPSLEMDPTISRLDGDEVDRNADLRRVAEGLWVEPVDLLTYLAPADGPFGRYRLAAIFPLPPDVVDPAVLCLDGPRGPWSSKHRNGPTELCLYYDDDPLERRWTEVLGLLRLFDLARRHVTAEHVWREMGQWPTEEAPHGRAEPALPDPSLALTPLRKARRNAPCPCGSGLKAKRCCFR
jgi:hypothetical protein